ncbi:MAG TPA: hypothetical protein VGB09_06710 [Candidatus Binatia bacterium]|jgi:hypothetical protein
MNKSKILEAILGHLVIALSAETDRFVSNKQPIRRLVADVLSAALNDGATRHGELM